MSTRLRCAIYTRKSSDEGLEQDFNSLAAQREACTAYIKSQAQAGWVTLAQHFDDGGYSGGTLERPGLQVLLAAIRARQVDVVVIYKIDRLSRSLTDFAKLAELFDAHQVSFFSVTQPFNTTTSMGRLILHVLLSFAQFEREVTAERIRDKLALSKRKGLWMGGFVPLGYQPHERTLAIDPTEAEVVRTIYRLYLELGSVRAVQVEARRLGLRTKRRVQRDGQPVGDRVFSRGHLYRLLTSPIYAGRIPHKDVSYPGQHPPLIDPSTWEEVQNRLRIPLSRKGSVDPTQPAHPLQGLVRDEHGARYRCTQTFKSGRRYRYYTHPTLIETAPEQSVHIRRLSAPYLEQRVTEALTGFLTCRRALNEALADVADWQTTAARAEVLAGELEHLGPERDALLRRLVAAVVVADTDARVELSRTEVAVALGPRAASDAEHHSQGPLSLPLPLQRRSGRAKWVLHPPDQGKGPVADQALVRTLVRADEWWQRLATGTTPSVDALARQEGVSPSLVTRIVRLAFLAPDIVAAILKGQHPPGLSARQLMNGPTLPLAWREQRERLGFPARPEP